MATNDFEPFGTGTTPNVIDQPTYAGVGGSGWRGSGFSSGIALVSQANKVWRQASSVAAMIGKFIVDYAAEDALDDGNIPVLEQHFVDALANLQGRLPGFQQEWLSADASLSNQSSVPYTYFLLQNGSFTFPAASPTGKFVLHVASWVNFGADGNGGASPSISYGQVRMRIRDITNIPFLDLIPIIGHLHVSSDVGASFDHHQSDIAGDRRATGLHWGPDHIQSSPGPAGPVSTILRYNAGQTIQWDQQVCLTNTGAYPIPTGTAIGRVILTALPG